MTKIIINVERLKKEVLDVEIELKDGETVESVIEKFKDDYKEGLYHSQFDDYGAKDCDVCFQNMKVYNEDYSTLHLENLDPIPEKETLNTKKRKP